jgi:hypothetical protein
MKKILLLSLLLLSALAFTSCGQKTENPNFGITLDELLASVNNIIDDGSVPTEGKFTKKSSTGYFTYNDNGSGFVITGSMKTQKVETITIFHPLKENEDDNADGTFFDDKDALIVGILHAIYPDRAPLMLFFTAMVVVGETERAEDGIFQSEEGHIFTRITDDNANILTVHLPEGAMPDLSIVPRLRQ